MGGVERRANPPQPFTTLARQAAGPLAWLAVAYTLFLVYYTHHPRPPLPAGAAAAGAKTLHFLAYGALAGFTGLAVAARQGWTWRVGVRLVGFLVAIALEGILNQQHDFFLKEPEMAIISLEQDLDHVSGRKELIVVNSGEFPTPMYFAHRKGWLATNRQVQDKSFIREVKAKGCRYIVILKRCFGTDIQLNYPRVFDSEDYSIYRL